MSRRNPSVSLSTLARFAEQAVPISQTQRHWGPQECLLFLNRVTPESPPPEVADAFERLIDTAFQTGVSLMPVMQLFHDRVAHGRDEVTVDEVLSRCTGDWRQRLVS